jgi:queuine tRNA-ribosyltransferase
MPDGTRGAVKGLTPEQVVGTGVEVVLANTYHLHMQPGEDVIATLGGIHTFSQRSGPILTDSGGFQVFSLAHINKITEEGVTFKDPKTGDTVFLSPEKSVQIQMKLGSDMLVAFDDVTALDSKGRGRTLEAFERTHRWLERSLAEFQRLTKDMTQAERPLLFGVVQGGLDKDLRKRSLEIVQSLAVDGIAIGGLSVGETREEMHDILEYLAPLYDDSARPRFLLGVGDPVDLRKAIECGIDMLDCVLPTRNARHATAWISGDKKIHLTNAKYIDDPSPIDPDCDCTTCQSGFSRGFLRHQFKVGESLAGSLTSIHNIRYLQRICEEYRK